MITKQELQEKLDARSYVWDNEKLWNTLIASIVTIVIAYFQMRTKEAVENITIEQQKTAKILEKKYYSSRY